MSVPVQHPMYIDGQFVTWRGDAWIDVVNPATEAVISRIPDGQAEDALADDQDDDAPVQELAHAAPFLGGVLQGHGGCSRSMNRGFRPYSMRKPALACRAGH